MDKNIYYGRFGCVLPYDGFITLSVSHSDVDRDAPVRNPAYDGSDYDPDYPIVENDNHAENSPPDNHAENSPPNGPTDALKSTTILLTVMLTLIVGLLFSQAVKASCADSDYTYWKSVGRQFIR